MAGFPEYESFDALGLAELIARGEIGAEEVLEAAVRVLEERNPALNAVVIPMIDRARDAVRGSLPGGPLRGVPFLLKDFVLQTTGVPTTNGSRLFSAHVGTEDSELVARYRRAGLVILGKTHTSEFGVSTSAESRLFGQTHNPWHDDLTAGGSSGGSSAAVAGGIVPAAHASDGGGSIRIPASCCGLFGLKPTRARTPLGPTLCEGWAGMSCVHAITRSVRDSAALLDLTCGPVLGDPYVAPPPATTYLSETETPPAKLRVALQRVGFNGAPLHEECERALSDAARLCAELGHEVEEARFEIPETLGTSTLTVICANTRATAEDRARELGRELQDDDLEPNTVLLVEVAKQIGAADYVRATREIHQTGRRLAAFMERYDVVLTPTMPTPPKRLGVLSLSNPDVEAFQKNVSETIAFTTLFNVAGVPAMSVPLYWTKDDVPIGVQFAARFGDEARLFRLARQLERARPWFHRRPGACPAPERPDTAASG